MSDTTAPPAGAAPFRVRVAVEGVPPVTVLGFKVSDVSPAGVTVSVVVLVVP